MISSNGGIFAKNENYINGRKSSAILMNCLGLLFFLTFITLRDIFVKISINLTKLFNLGFDSI